MARIYKMNAMTVYQRWCPRVVGTSAVHTLLSVVLALTGLVGSAQVHVPGTTVPSGDFMPKVTRYDLYVTDTVLNYTGKDVPAIAVNGQTPMPTLYFTEGDTAMIVLHNKLRKGEIDAVEFGRVRDAALEIQDSPLYIDATGGISMAKLAARAVMARKPVMLVTMDAQRAGAVDQLVVDLARQKPQRQADHAGGMRQHPFDREMGLAGVGGAEHGSDARAGCAAVGGAA